MLVYCYAVYIGIAKEIFSGTVKIMWKINKNEYVLCL